MRIVSYDHAMPEDRWYDQSDDEWVIVLQGGAKLAFDDGSGPVDLFAGDYLYIPAHRRHRVAWTDPVGPTVWLAVHIGSGIAS